MPTAPPNAAMPPDTMKLSGSIYLGHHYTIGGGYSREMNPLRYKVDSAPNCRDNFIAALESFGMGKTDIVANVNFFMSAPVAAGTMAISRGISTAGDHVDLRPDANVIAVISNCPQVYNPCNDYTPTVRVVVWVP
jgi:uncharacterized protein YcgI (DUF1989 family)